jgi:RNA polymerase sigma factor (sigma-70 family)
MKPLNDEIISNLIENAQMGRDAFEQLVRQYQHDVFRMIRVYTQNDSDAEDLAQETWVKVYRSIRKLKPPYHFDNWIKKVALNTVKDWLRSRAYKESQSTDEISSQQLWGSAVIQYQRQKRIEEIRDAVDSLSEKNRQVVLDFYILGYSASEVSQRLSVPVSTVNSRLKEARKKLREEFESMVAQSAIREKFAPDSLIRNVMDRVASMPIPPPLSPPNAGGMKGGENIIQRIGRIFPTEAIPIIGFVLVMFTVIALISINAGYIHFDFKGNQKQNAMIAAPAQEPQQAQNEGRIVFHRQPDLSIWVMDADGKNEKQLTTGNACPVWSPDGRKIAFYSLSNPGIYIMSADGSNMKRLTSGPVDWNPTWSPDGKQIAFQRDTYEQNPDGEWEQKNWAIYVVNADGSNLRRLGEAFQCRKVGDRITGGGMPAWSPDGRQIAYYDYPIDRPAVCVMDANGENRKTLYWWGGNMGMDWSPNGDKIVFASSQDSWKNWKGTDIYVINADGTNLRRLTQPGPSFYQDPAWSPDGTKIVFILWDGKIHNEDIYVMNADGSNVQQLTNTPVCEYRPDWTVYSYGVEPTGKLKSTWGKIKREPEDDYTFEFSKFY